MLFWHFFAFAKLFFNGVFTTDILLLKIATAMEILQLIYDFRLYLLTHWPNGKSTNQNQDLFFYFFYRLTQECRNSERQLGIAREELRKVREAQKEKEKREEELCQQSTLHNFQIEEIKRLLADSKATNQSLIEERYSMILLPNRVIQLQYCFCVSNVEAKRKQRFKDV